MADPTVAPVPSWFHRRPDAAVLEWRDAPIEPAAEGFTGYAATFLTADSYGTAFAPGAFKKSLSRRSNLPVLWQHDPSAPIGRHLAIKEDRRGLFVDVNLIDDGAEGSVALKRLRGGVPLGQSFGFQTKADRSATDEDDLDLTQLPKGTRKADIRVITDVMLWETSLVTFPANEAATISAVRDQLFAASAADPHNIATLTAALAADALDEAQEQLAAAFVAAYQARSGSDSLLSHEGKTQGVPRLLDEAEHATQAFDQARRHREIAVALALAHGRQYLHGEDR